MRAGLNCFTTWSDLWDGRAVGFQEFRPGADQEVINVMCSASDQDGKPMAMGSVAMPNTWEPVVVGDA